MVEVIHYRGVTMNSIELSTWITAFFVLAGFAAVLAVAGIAMVLPRRTAFVDGTVFDVEVPTGSRVVDLAVHAA
jgi:hypothetical protein